MLLFYATSCLAVAVQSCMEWIPIKKENLLESKSDWNKFKVRCYGTLLYDSNSKAFAAIRQLSQALAEKSQ